jgi:hypothetical protein
MISKKNGSVSITGRDQIVFSIVLFMLDLTLHLKALARTHVDTAINTFRDLGLPVHSWLFDLITATWDTRLAWGTPTARIAFPMDDSDPGDGCETINRGRRRQIWQAITSALDCEASATAPPWVTNAPEIGSDLPSGDAMLQVMAEVIGDELLDRLSGEAREPQETAPAPPHDHPQRDPLCDVIERLKVKCKDEPDVEFGFQ